MSLNDQKKLQRTNWEIRMRDWRIVPRSPVPRSPIAITVDELAKHNTTASTWIAVDGRVYDVTTFLSLHPGGALSIQRIAGRDATREYAKYHDFSAEEAIGSTQFVGLLQQVNEPPNKPTRFSKNSHKIEDSEVKKESPSPGAEPIAYVTITPASLSNSLSSDGAKLK